MALTNDLLTQFAKITNDNQTPKKETILYGTIVDQDGTNYVRLDGSDLLTPVATVAKTYAGERVVVMIKNHSAIVMGNITSPSARAVDVDDANNSIAAFDSVIANLVTTEQLSVETGRIDTLISDNVLIKERLLASEGDIDNLQANYLTVDGKLTAVEGDIDNLETTKLDASVAEITYATIANLNALDVDVRNLESTYATFESTTTQRLTAVEGVIADLDVGSAEIGSLRTEVADIKTLIYGSATGDTIHTSFSNAVVAQIGDAQIKSAMIESISADKITAGDIITNNVRVKSKDGSLLISDETMQISDGTRVRVQIGKDAANDYSINIWDQNGNLMFSKGGITDSAIKTAIIRNDMVSDTADIHASKLDIDSLFEEINGSTNTIKSTKVYLDENKQTLDVAFKSLSTTVTSQGETITSQGTAISTIQGQISSKIWQQDINTAKGEMSTQYSTLEQSLNSYKTTVGETYATTEDVESDISALDTRVLSAETSIIQLSDRITANISETTSLGTRTTSLELASKGLTARLNELSIGGRNLLLDSAKTVENSTYGLHQFTYADPTQIVAGETYTVSFDGMLTDAVQVGFYINTYPSPYKGCCSINAISTDGVYHRYKATFTMPDNGSFTQLGIYSSNTGNGKLAGVKNIKLEKGNQATDWTPAPEDVDDSILTASKTATDYLNFSSAGLVVGNLTATALGKNVLIGSDDIRIRTGTTDNAVFGADIIELAKDNASATISMLNGAFKIYYDADNSDGGFGVYGVTSTGEERLAFQPVNENDNLTIGWGGYHAKKNCTNIYGHNMNLVAGNDLAIECDDWKINIDGNLFAKASTSSFIELIGLSSDDNVAIGHGGYSAAIGKTNIYGNKIQHIVNTSSGTATYKPYYEAGDSFETEWYGAGFISSSSKVVYFSIPLAKPVIGSSTPNVTVTNATTGTGGLQVRQDSNYVFGSTSSSKVTPSSYNAKVVGSGNFVQIEATMANSTNAVNNSPCGINANIKITFS